jgi:DNA-binding response OmpR family regulator
MSQNQLKICIIEDMKPIRKLLTTILEKAGFATVDFPDGTSSMEWLRDNKPDAVVMDIMLPDMSGTDVLHYIRSLSDGSKIPVIAVTGFAQPGDRDKYISSGFDHYIAKPINTATFPDDIKKLIRKSE